MTSKKKPSDESASERSKKNMPRTGVGKAGSGGRRSGRGTDRWVKKPAELTDRPVCKKCGQVHTKCNGHTKHGPNKGKPCGANRLQGS